MYKLTFIIILTLALSGCSLTQTNQANTTAIETTNTPSLDNIPVPKISPFSPPLNHATERITKKPFEIKITPADSPVQPEKFSGYHTGTDFETFPEEADVVVPVQAICDGKLIMAKTASGYGGVVAQSCEYNNEPITIVYGHLTLASLTKKVGDTIIAGDHLADLGQGFSQETDGERKHLHLGIHKGSEINIRGYVQTQTELDNWLDYTDYTK